MKTHLTRVVVMLLAVGLLTGCPWRRVPVEFTSADVYSGYRDGMPPGIGAEVEFDNETGESERELVEPDIIRRDGNLLYVLNQYRGLTIVDLDVEAVLSQTATFGYPRDLYLVGDRAYVLVSYAHDVHYDAGIFSVSYGSKLYVLNVADPSAVALEGTFAFEGDLIDSRMVGDVIYAVCSDYTWYGGDGGVTVDAAQKSYGATWAVSLNIADPSNIAIADTLSFPGYGNLIQATNYAIFSVSTHWESSGATSAINYIDISDPQGKIALRGVALAPGYMADRFKMDAWDGVLRVVTNTGWPVQETYITTFDIINPDSMDQIGQTTLESASGESLFATRFDGPLAYIVTYFMVDPLFVIDLSDPANPQVKGELKIPGWSTHIEPRGDRLIALGVDDTGGGRKVQVSLFDVSNPENPQRIAYESFGDDWAWSSAYNDVKAFTVMDDMLLIPFSGWNTSGGYDRLQFVSYTRDTLDAQGYVDLQGSALRSFAYEGFYYAVTQEQLAVIDPSNLVAPSVVASVTLAENVVDAIPIPGGWLIEVITRNDSGDTVLCASHAASGVVGENLTLPLPYVSNAFLWNNAVAVVGSVYEYEPEFSAYYNVFLVDFSTPEQPEILRDWQVAMEPWWGGWGWYYPFMEGDAVRPANSAKQYWGGYGDSGDSVCLAGDYLVLRGTAKAYDITFGDEQPWQGIALVDLAGADEVSIVGLGYQEVVSVATVGGHAYITSKMRIGNDWRQRGICAYYLHILNPATLDMERTVNVPGAFLHRVPGTNTLLFEDQQYANNWQTVTILQSAALTDSAVRPIDSKALPSGYWDIMAEGTNVWYCGQPYAYDVVADGSGGDVVAVSSVDVSDPGNGQLLGKYVMDASGRFTDNQELDVGTYWCNLLGVKDNQACLSIQSAALAHCNFGLTPPGIAQMIPIMGYPTKVRFSEDTAYVPLGYSGLAILSL